LSSVVSITNAAKRLCAIPKSDQITSDAKPSSGLTINWSAINGVETTVFVTRRIAPRLSAKAQIGDFPELTADHNSMDSAVYLFHAVLVYN
jgi:hypothetical protein